MGLDTTHDAWHGAYGAFNRWRNTIAEVAGYKLIEISYDGGYKSEGPDIDWDSYALKNYQGEWDTPPADPLIYLIVHSDCDGILTPGAAGAVADRLRGLLPLLPEGEGGGHIGYWREKTQYFIDGLQDAYDLGEEVEFH